MGLKKVPHSGPRVSLVHRVRPSALPVSPPEALRTHLSVPAPAPLRAEAGSLSLACTTGVGHLLSTRTRGLGEGRCCQGLVWFTVSPASGSLILSAVPACGCLGGPWRASEEVGPVLNPSSWPEAPVRDAAGLRPVPVGNTWHNPAAWGAPQASPSSPSSLPRTLGPPGGNSLGP